MSDTFKNQQFEDGFKSYCAGLSLRSNPYSSTWGMSWARGWKQAHREDCDPCALELPSLSLRV